MNQHPKEDHASASLRNVAVVSIVAVLLMADVARLTVVSAFVETRPELASRLAPHSPDTLAATAMAEVGEAAAQGVDPSQETLDRLRLLATAAPLRPEPFLVEAALAQRTGDYARAEQLLIQARMRAPRSAAARYLLADVWLRRGKVVESLREIAILTRLLPGASIQLVPALAEYARTPGARDELTAILAENPQLKWPLLNALAADPENTDLVLTFAGSDLASADSRTRTWQSRLIRGFIERGDYVEAHALWQRFARVGTSSGSFIFNGDFRPISAPPPFNWDLSSSRAGLAEPENGQLRVLYFGRTNTRLASQLLLLPAGTYRFISPVRGEAVARALEWSIRCSEGKNPLTSLPVGAVATSSIFIVPPSNCDAQWLELKGYAQDISKESDVRIGPVRIERVTS